MSNGGPRGRVGARTLISDLMWEIPDHHDAMQSFPAFVSESLCRTGGHNPARSPVRSWRGRTKPVGHSWPMSAPSVLRSATCCRRRWTCRPAMVAAFTSSRWIASTGAMTPAGIYEMGTSPSCLVVNAAGTRLYSANETDRVGDDKEGTVSAFAIDRADGNLTLLNTVRSGGAGPTYVSLHPSGRFMLVANYFGGSVAVLPILPDGRLGDATDVKNDAGKIGPTKANERSAGQLRLQRTRPDPRAHDPGRSRRAVRAARRPGPGPDLRLEVRRPEGRADAERPARGLAAARRRAAAFLTSTPMAAGSTPSRRKARPSCCSTTTPRRVG